MKYVFIASFGIIFTFIVGSFQALIYPQNWTNFQDINPTTWIGIGLGYILLMGYAVFCLKQVQKIDEKDKKARWQELRQELRQEVRDIFKDAELRKSWDSNKRDEDTK